MDFPFANNLTFGVGPVKDRFGVIHGEITDYGGLYSYIETGYDNHNWPMTDCLNDESTPSEVSDYELFLFL
jgi:hypothetical protein